MIYINIQILFLTVYMVCIYLGTPAIPLFYSPICKNQETNAKYNMAVEENKCNISYHRNICFIFQTSLAIVTDPESVSRLACDEGE